MELDWAAHRLREHIRLTTLHSTPYDMGVFDELRATSEAILTSAQVVEKIMDRVTPGWRGSLAEDPAQQWQPHRAAAIRALAEIETAEEVATRLGENAPTLNAAAMHPWAWEGARSLWQSGHFGEAVRAAVVKVNAELQNKLGRRDISEVALVQEAFSDNAPTVRAARLRLAGDDDGRTAKSIRRGIVALAEACFGAIRNPASHDPITDVSEQVALEQLAAVSLLARWIDTADVINT